MEADSIVERADRSGRIRFCRDVLPEIASWMLMMWERQNKIACHTQDRDPHLSAEYARQQVAAAAARMEHIQEMMLALPDAWKADDYTEPMIRVGMMIAAKDDAGNHLTKLGRAMAEAGLTTDGTGPG